MFIDKVTVGNKISSFAWRVFNKFENNGSASFNINGEKLFLENLFSYYSKSNNRRVIFDIGANIGSYSKILLDNIKANNLDIDIHLFEPTKDCFEELVKQFGSNENMILNKFGLSNKDQYRKIFYDKEKSGLASLYKRDLEHYNISFEGCEDISVKRLDNYIKEKNVSHIDFIKIDIEGHELKAFEGFGGYIDDGLIDIIQFEYGGANLDSHTSLMEICSLFSKKNYKLFKIMKNGLQARDYQPYMENFMNSNYVVMTQSIFNKISM